MQRKDILDLLKKYDDETYLREQFHTILEQSYLEMGDEQIMSF